MQSRTHFPHNAIGFMQGRPSPMRNGRIQSFPWETWDQEFEQARNMDFSNIEWTIDSEKFFENPLLTKDGTKRIKQLCKINEIHIPSVTCDYFMENPSWNSNERDIRGNLIKILDGMTAIGSRILVIPLVDNSSIRSQSELLSACEFFQLFSDELQDRNIQIAFESDFPPLKLNAFLANFNANYYGVNFDVGNSAGLGYNPEDEFFAYGSRILNVHVKDRILGGITVPLGEGSADFRSVFRLLREHSYGGNFILQTARSNSGGHEEVLLKYKQMLIAWLEDEHNESR